jgi:predicted nucleotidyltransferase
MRKSDFLKALFPKIRQGILATTYLQPEQWWYLSEVAELLETAPSSLQREIESLSKNGLLRTKREGNRLYFQAETDSPVFKPLQELMRQTMGIVPALAEAIAQVVDKIDFAFIYGSVARGEEHSLSDVDVLIIGELGLSEIANTLRNLEKKFGREINVSSYKKTEFIDKIKEKNHFVNEIIDGEKLFLKGISDEFEQFAKQ